MLLTPNDVLERGLDYMGIKPGKKKHKRLVLEIHKHYGSSPLVLADLWYDLCYWKADLLPEKDKSERGFKNFMAAQYWMWSDAKNQDQVASRFGFCIDKVRGKGLWKWIERIASMMEKKIKWKKSLSSSDMEIFAISADGVDFKMWERKHPDLPVDTKAMSHKFKSCGAKYIIALSVFEPKCVFIEGPFRGAKHDLDIFRESGLMKKLQKNGKVCIADRGFISRKAAEKKHFATPDYMDSTELSNFKSRSRLRQETYNRRLKHFGCLSNTWRFGFAKHGIALRAVAVVVQYQMDNGSPIFAV